MGRLVVVSNRVPPPRERAQPAGGLAVGLKDAIAGRDTLWFGWSGKQSTGTRLAVSQSGRLAFATVDLTDAQYRGFYRGFSNGMLWPLLHGQLGLSEFRRADLDAYLAVNSLFASALSGQLRPDDSVWVHDYHLIPLGEALREAGATQRLGFFLHTPFPPPFLFDMLPQGERLLRSFAAYDVVGTQTADDAANLNACLAAAGIATRAQAFPIGIDPDAFARDAERAEGGAEDRRLHDSLGDRALILGVDRLDYTKGLPQRLRGFAQLLARFPEHRGHVSYLQVTPVSRGDVSQYRALRRELDELAGFINGEHAEFDWVPLHYITRSVPRTTLAGFHRRARVGLVTPLRDGMNLVAKEYVAAQDPADPGVLVLSRFAGAAPDMAGAVLVNPYDPDEIAEAIHAALTLDADARRERWATMHAAVTTQTAAAWAKAFLAALDHA